MLPVKSSAYLWRMGSLWNMGSRCSEYDPAARGRRPPSSYVPENSSSESRGNRPAGDLRLQRIGYLYGSRVFGGGPQLAACTVCGRGDLHWAGAQQRKLSEHSAGDQRGGDYQRRCHSSRLWIFERERELRESVRSIGNHVYRPHA